METAKLLIDGGPTRPRRADQLLLFIVILKSTVGLVWGVLRLPLMAPSVELSKRLFAFTSLCGALSADRATPFHGKSMENVSGRREWRGVEGDWRRTHCRRYTRRWW